MKMSCGGLMMDFDDPGIINLIDQEKSIEKIRNLAGYLTAGWNFSQNQPGINIKNISHLIFAGSSKLNNVFEILNLLVDSSCIVPIMTIYENKLPKWCIGSDKLLILLVDEENLEDMSKLLEDGNNNHCTIVTISTNPFFKRPGEKISEVDWILVDHVFSRFSLGFDVMVLFGLLHKLNLADDISTELIGTITSIERTISVIDLDISAALNPAKRLAGQMMGRWIKIIGGGFMVPVAKRWSNQINECAKTLSYPEDIHQLINHSINGIFNPEEVVRQSMVVFLKSNINHEKIENLIDLSKEELMCNGIGTDVYLARGETIFSQVWNTILFGDYLAFYLSIAYEIDPSLTMRIK
jgi:glucose/mannose-6-phosphate isomerase